MARSRSRRSSKPNEERKPSTPDKGISALPDEELLEDDSLELLEDEEQNGHVRVTHELHGDRDVRVTVAVGEMEKAAVIEAVTPPLRNIVSEIAPELRWRTVSVDFTGSTLIPSAVKDLVNGILADAKPLKVIVHRGYGDECIYEASPPTVQWSSRPDESYALKDLVEVETGDLDSADLAVALRPELEKAATQAAGRTFDITFSGNASPDAQTVAEIASTLRRAGASRVALTRGDDVEILFDEVLEDLIAVREGSGDLPTTIEITARDKPEATLQAMALVLPRARETLTGKRVRVRFSRRAPRAGELAALLRHAADFRPDRLDLDTGDDTELLWPTLLTVNPEGPACRVTLDPAGRDLAAIRKALHREAASLEQTAGLATTIEWPAGFSLDEDLEAALFEALAAHGPERVAYTFGGDDREPVSPPPVAFRAEGTATVCDLDTDSGKPPELTRAILRRIPGASAALRGRDVTVNILGSGAVSRTMRRALLDELKAAGAALVRLCDHGEEDVILPPLLDLRIEGDDLEVTATLSGRDTAQVERAVARELESVDCPAGATVRFAGEVTGAITERFLGKGAGRLIVDGQQVHPALLDSERDGDMLTIRTVDTPYAAEDPMPQLERELPAILAEQGDLTAVSVTLVWPGATSDSPHLTRAQELVLAAGPAAFLFDDGDGLPMQLYPEEVLEEIEEPEIEEPAVDEPDLEPIEELVAGEPAPPPEIAILGRKDDSTPPMVVLGIDWTEDEAAAATVESKLEAMAAEVEGRRVLAVFRAQGADRQGPGDSTLVQKVQRALASKVAALLLYRARGRRNPAHFEVVHSNLAELPAGMKVRDPRRSA